MLYYIEQIIYSELTDWYTTSKNTYEVFNAWYYCDDDEVEYIKMIDIG